MSDFGFGPRYTTTDEREKKIIRDVNEALSALNIRLSKYGAAVKATVNAVYKVGVGYGYEFTCVDYPALKETLEKHPEFIRDDRNTLLGCFMAAKTKGTGYRQIGNSSSVHFQIDNNQCDVHVDSHGVVNQLGQYSLVGMLAHVPWDLLPYMTNYGYVRLGENVLLAPTIGLSPSMVTRLVSFYDNGLKGDLPTLKEFGSGVQFGYDLQIGAHTRFGVVGSVDTSYTAKIKPSLSYESLVRAGRLTLQVSKDDFAASGELNLGTYFKIEGAASGQFDSGSDLALKVFLKAEGRW